jgi:uncharacterized membrane protein YedE/YeeE
MQHKNLNPLLVLGAGVAFGFVVSGIGFTRYDALLDMFTFNDTRMFLAFAGAVALSILAYRVLRGRRPMPRRRMHKGTVPGALAFGVGWVICGACPSIAFAQLGQGKLWALFSLAGMVGGAVLFERLNRRFWHLGRDSC